MCSSRLRRSPIFSFINLLLFLGAVVFLFVSIFHLQGSVLYRCPQCVHFHTIAIGTSITLMVIALLGLLSIEMKSKIILVFYKFLIFLMFLVSIAFLVSVVLLKFGVFNGLLSYGWDAAVKHATTDVCEFQQLFHCTGWVKTCEYNVTVIDNGGGVKPPPKPHNSTNSSKDRFTSLEAAIKTAAENEEVDINPHEAASHFPSVSWRPFGPDSTDCPQCNTSAAKGSPHYNFTSFDKGQTCSKIVFDAVDRNFTNLLIGAGSSWAVLLLINFIAYRAGRKFSYLYDSSDFEGSSSSDDGENPRGGRRKRWRGGPSTPLVQRDERRSRR